MFELGVTGSFEAAHRLRGDFGPATRLHGHTYRVEVAVRGRALAEDGTLFDIGALQGALDAVLADLHFQDLDSLRLFEGRNTTAEVVAQTIWDRVTNALALAGIEELTVRVWESPRAYASYTSRPG